MVDRKPCPFCGAAIEVQKNGAQVYHQPTTKLCILAAKHPFDADLWDQRPAETALEQRVRDLEAALRECLVATREGLDAAEGSPHGAVVPAPGLRPLVVRIETLLAPAAEAQEEASDGR